MTADVELLPLPSPQVPFIDCDPSMTDIRRLVRWYEQGATEYASANVSRATARLQAEIEALRAEQEVIVAEAKKYAGESGRLKAKVELLAEALRLAEEHINDITPEWYSAGQRVLAAIRAALRDHDQEDDDA